MAATAAVALGFALLPAGGAQAGLGDVVLNPGAFSMTVEGGFMNLAGTVANLRATSDPARCNDNSNSDPSVNGGNDQDTNIDWDGKLGSGADGQCNGLNNTLKAADDSEVKSLNQVKAQITIAGTVAADGTVDVTSVTIPPEYLFAWTDPVASTGGLVLDVTFAADVSGTDNGSINPATGAAELDVAFDMRIVQAFFGIDCTIGPISMTLTNDAAAPENQGSIAVSQQPYNTSNGSVRVSNNIYTIPVSHNTDPLNTSNACTNVIDPGFGLPAASGASAAEFYSVSTPIAQSGLTTISGTVLEDGSGNPLENISVRLNDSTTLVTVAKVSTDASGNYTIPGVPAGSYIMRFVDLDGLHVPEFHSGQPTRFTATTIVADGTNYDVDASLDPTGTGNIRGVVTEEGSGTPLQGISVRLLTDTNVLLQARNSKVDGSYAFDMTPHGNYKMRWIDPDASHIGEWYLNGTTRFDATVINHNAWFTYIDAALTSSST